MTKSVASCFDDKFDLITLVPNHRESGLASISEQSSFRLSSASNVDHAVSLAKQATDCIVLIESSTAGVPAADLCLKFRQQLDRQVVVVSSSDFASGRMTCWQAGADVVLAPNCSVDEIVCACRSATRRLVTPSNLDTLSNANNWSFEQQSFRLIHEKGGWVRLSRNEAQIMLALCQSRNQVVKRNVLWELLDKADWRYNDRTLDVLIARIRAKMRQVDIDPRVILTHYGAGYELRINS